MIDRHLNYGRHVIEFFAKKIKTYSKVLDIGAGNGDDLMIYRKINPEAELFALEFYQPNISILEEKGIKACLCDIERDRFPFEDCTFDIINANQILEHTKEIYWIFHEISRTLKVGGYLVIGVPNLASLHNRILLLLGKHPTCIKSNSAHVRGFTKYDILKFLDIWGGV